jgi:hypothetical protein
VRMICSKAARLRLDPLSYERLRQQIVPNENPVQSIGGRRSSSESNLASGSRELIEGC